MNREFFIKIGATPQEADQYAAAELTKDEPGGLQPLMEAQNRYHRGFLFRRNAHRWFNPNRRPANVHYGPYSDGKYITLACTEEEVRPDGKQEYAHKEAHEPMVFSAEGKLFTFSRWWTTCEDCLKKMKERRQKAE